eukprot:298643-Prymnesium_polylepis.1
MPRHSRAHAPRPNSSARRAVTKTCGSELSACDEHGGFASHSVAWRAAARPLAPSAPLPSSAPPSRPTAARNARQSSGSRYVRGCTPSASYEQPLSAAKSRLHCSWRSLQPLRHAPRLDGELTRLSIAGQGACFRSTVPRWFLWQQAPTWQHCVHWKNMETL